MNSSSACLSQNQVDPYSTPKRIKVVRGSNGIEVRLESDPENEQPRKEINTPSTHKQAETAEPESSNDGYFTVELESNNASFVIPDEQWETIKPRKMPSGGRLLTGPWSNILSEYLKESNPYCCFAFHYNRLKTENSRKRLAPFFKGIGICKIKECGVTVRLLIRGINENTRLVDVSYTGKIRHKLLTPWKGVVRTGKPRTGMMLLGLAEEPS